MRAGTLSDPRVVALISKYFVPVHMTELCTRDLLGAKDAALLVRLGERYFYGGEREAFLTPEGRLVDVFLSLHLGRKQFTRAGRADREAAVARFFKGAERAWRAVRGDLPQDWAKVSAVAAAAPTEPDGRRVRVALRHDWMMYEDLAGSEFVTFPEAEAAAIASAGTWPRAAFVRLARTFYPRGGGVLIDLADTSVKGGLRTRIVNTDANEVSGTLEGKYELTPQADRERSRRETYKPFVDARGTLRGDFVWDRAQRKFTRFRLIGVDAVVRCRHGDVTSHACRLGVELR